MLKEKNISVITVPLMIIYTNGIVIILILLLTIKKTNNNIEPQRWTPEERNQQT